MRANGQAPATVADALRLAVAGLDYLNSPAGELDGAACGQVLAALGQIHARFTAAQASVLRRFDAADAHDGDGYGTSAAWLAAMTQMSRKDAKATVQEMRRLAAFPDIREALAAGKISRSFGLEIIELVTKNLPAELRGPTAAILLQAAIGGASLDDLKVIAAAAAERWKAAHPDPDDGGGFDDRSVRVETTFGSAGCIHGNLTPECATAVQAVLDALGKRHGPEDTRTEAQRWHDALQLGCELLIRANMVPDRAGADTHVSVHIGLGQLLALPSGSAVEAAWLAGRAGEPGYLTGDDAMTAACDALTIPVVIGHADMTIIDRIIDLALAYAHSGGKGAGGGTADGADGRRRGRRPGQPGQQRGRPDGQHTHRPGWHRRRVRRDWQPSQRPERRGRWRPRRPEQGRRAVPAGTRRAPPRHRPARRRLPVRTRRPGFGPAHQPARRSLQQPQPPPGHRLFREHPGPHPPRGHPQGQALRLAALRQARGLVRRAPHRAQEIRGKTSVDSCILLCQFHHDVCIHRWGWQITLHSDGTTTARGPHGQILRSHDPPTGTAA